MSYAATIPVEFPFSRHRVYEALCDLGSHPRWNTGLTSISYTGTMHAGLEYVTKTNVMGKINQATVRVVELIPDEAIVLDSSTGLITFRAAFQIQELTPDSCTVICNLRFEFSKLVFNLAQSAVESLAEARIRGDLETLRSQLGKSPA
jgi:hypothetical protein